MILLGALIIVPISADVFAVAMRTAMYDNACDHDEAPPRSWVCVWRQPAYWIEPHQSILNHYLFLDTCGRRRRGARRSGRYNAGGFVRSCQKDSFKHWSRGNNIRQGAPYFSLYVVQRFGPTIVVVAEEPDITESASILNDGVVNDFPQPDTRRK